MLLAADAVLSGVRLPEEMRTRTGVFIELNLDLNTTNYHFRWWVLKHAEEWAERLGLRPPSPEYAAWKRTLLDAAGTALNANRVMEALGSIAASRWPGVPPGRPKFHHFERGNVGYARLGSGGSRAAARRT